NLKLAGFGPTRQCHMPE
ncbi:unnamed protein product, partial [Rotaria sp. Silwood1]